MKIVLISCVSKKLSHPAQAKDLYCSPLFKYSLAYAKQLNPDKLFILSALHGLIPLEKEIEPYNSTLKAMNSQERKDWAAQILCTLQKEIDLRTDEVVFLAGNTYRQHLLPHITHYTIPLQGLGIGRQLKFLKEHTT